MTEVNYVNQEDWSLWNITIKKMKRVKNYVKRLMPLPSWDLTEEKRFTKLINKALKLNNANEILRFIGYNPLGKDKIYDEIMKEE